MNERAKIAETEAEVWRPSAALNLERLRALFQFTEQIAFSSIVPETLTHDKPGNDSTRFDDQKIIANVFAVVEQADRWNISPFALLSSAAIVRGKLAFEGKVIAAVMEAQFGVKLYPYYRGEPRTDNYRVFLCDVPLPQDILDELEPGYRNDAYRIIDGSVGEWKTTGNGTPWKPATYADMLIYRGSRQWARVYKAGAILGVLADDEAHQLALENAAQNATPITQRFAAPPSTQGFNADYVAAALEHKPQVAMEIMDPATGALTEVAATTTTTHSGAQPGGDALKTTAEPKADQAKASATPADVSVGNQGDGSTDTGGRPTETPSSPPAGANDGTGDAGTPAPAARVSAEIFRGYHSALARMATKENVEKSHKAFWGGKGIKLAHADDLKLGKDIYENHLLRVEGKVDANYLAAEIEKWIVQVTGDQL